MRFLSGKEKKELNDSLPKLYSVDKKDDIKIKDDIVYNGEKKFLIIKDGKYLPHLSSLPEGYPAVITDKGAIPFIAKGADLMRPGIKTVEGEFAKGDIIILRDETKRKAYGIGFALLSSEEMKVQTSGKSVAMYHFLGDKYY